MKILLDQNISFKVVNKIGRYYPGITHIKEANLINASDLDIRKYANKNGFTIVTYDDDFNKYNQLFGPPPKIIWIRKGNLSNENLSNHLIRKKE